MKPLKSGRAKTYSRPLAWKSGGAFALPALLQLVPPLLSLLCCHLRRVHFHSSLCGVGLVLGLQSTMRS